MSESTFQLVDKAEQLVFAVLDITTNRSHYPVKFRRLSDRLQEYVLNIQSSVIDANSIKPDTEFRKARRFELQTQAIAGCNKFLSLTKYSLHAKLISSSTSEVWTGLAHDIKFMALAWRK